MENQNIIDVSHTQNLPLAICFTTILVTWKRRTQPLWQSNDEELICHNSEKIPNCGPPTLARGFFGHTVHPACGGVVYPCHFLIIFDSYLVERTSGASERLVLKLFVVLLCCGLEYYWTYIIYRIIAMICHIRP